MGRGAPRAAPAPPPRPAAPRRPLGSRRRARPERRGRPPRPHAPARRRTATATRRCASSSASTARCAASSASRPAARRWRCATACSPSTTSSPRRDDSLVGRDPSWRSPSRRCSTPPAGRSRTLIVAGPAGIGKSSLLAAITTRAEGAGLPRRPRNVGAGRGGMAVRAGGRGARRPVPAPPDAARRPARPPPGGDRPGARRRRGHVDRRELAPAALRRRRRAGPPGVGHERSAAHHRRRARRRRRQPAPAPLHRPSTHDQRVCIVLAHRPAPDDATRSAETRQSLIEPPRRDRARARSARRRRRRRPRPPPRRRTDHRAGRADRGARPGHPVRGERAGPPGRHRAPMGAGARRQHDRRHRAHRPARCCSGSRSSARRSTPTSSSRCPGCPRTEAFDHLDAGARRADRRAGEHRLPVPPRPRARRAARRRPAAPPPRASTATPPSRLIELDASPARIGHHLLAGRRGRRGRALPAAGGRDGGGDRRLPRRARARRRRPAARHRRAPGHRAVAARRPAQRDRRPDGDVGLPRGARRRRSRRQCAGCAPGSPAAP